MTEEISSYALRVLEKTAESLAPGVPEETQQPQKTFSSSHAAFADNFGLICTILSCGIVGYQIMQHLRYYTQPAIQL